MIEQTQVFKKTRENIRSNDSHFLYAETVFIKHINIPELYRERRDGKRKEGREEKRGMGRERGDGKRKEGWEEKGEMGREREGMNVYSREEKDKNSACIN